MNPNESYREGLTAALNGLRFVLAEPEKCDLGLCDLIRFRTRRNWPPIYHRLQVLFQAWPEFSGNPSYPVPCSTEELERLQRLAGGDGIQRLDPTPATRAVDAYCATSPYVGYSSERYTGEYGQARLRLAQYLLQAFEAELTEYPNEEPPCPNSCGR